MAVRLYPRDTQGWHLSRRPHWFSNAWKHRIPPKKYLPYSALFDVHGLQEEVRTSSRMGDRATGGSRIVTVVERAPPGLQVLPFRNGGDPHSGPCDRRQKLDRNDLQTVVPATLLVRTVPMVATCAPPTCEAAPAPQLTTTPCLHRPSALARPARCSSCPACSRAIGRHRCS